MKKTTHCGVAREAARKALDEVESAFGVKTGVKAGDNGLHTGWNNPNNPHYGPIIQPLYGVIINTDA